MKHMRESFSEEEFAKLKVAKDGVTWHDFIILLALTKTVWIVFKHGEEGESIYAICHNEKIAEKARTKLAAVLGEVETHFEIQEIARDAVHPFGILCMDGSVDVG
jgi:acetone carboxylase gamma subunit